MKYSDLLQILQGFSAEQLDREVIVSVGKSEDEISPVEDVRFLRENNHSWNLEEGHPYFRIL